MNEVEMMSPSKVAEQYGGDKRKIAQAVQVGILDPTVGVMAGMFIDRVRNAALAEQKPHQTVAQQVLAPQQPQMTAQAPQAGLQAAAAAPMERGLAALPVDESMVPGGEGYAGGGIIAFADRGYVDGDLTEEEIAQLSGNVPYSPRFFKNKEIKEEVEKYWKNRFPVEQGPSLKDKLLNYLIPSYQTPKTVPGPGVGLGEVPSAPVSVPAAAGPTPAAAATSSLADSIKAATANAPRELTPEEFKKQQAAFGVQEDPFKDIRERIASMAGESKLDREYAKNMALAQAGAAMMSGTSPYALTNIGKGVATGLTQFGADIKDIKAAEKELFKLQTELAKADDARARGDFKGFQDFNDKAKDHALKLEKLGVDKAVAQAQIAHYNRPGTYAELGAAAEQYPWLKDRFTAGMESAETNRAKIALAAIDNALISMKKDDPRRKDMEQQRATILQQLMTPTAAGAGTKGKAQFLGFE